MNNGTNDMTTYTYDIDSFSDLYKESHGFRPSAGFYERLDRSSPDELQAEWDYLLKVLDINLREEERQQAEAHEELMVRLELLAASNKVDVKTVIRWFHDAESTNGDNEYLDYRLGVKYGTVASLLAA